MDTLTVETFVAAPIDRVWSAWTTPADIQQWNAALDSWHTPLAVLDLRAGGSFCYRMEARDGSAGFDYKGRFTQVEPQRRIDSELDDGRKVSVEFLPQTDGTLVRETFEVEASHTLEQQRTGWQSILDNFTRHVLSRA